MKLPRLALSINQPWAWLIIAGHKDIENRNWTTQHRGEIAIHTGLSVQGDAIEDLCHKTHPATGLDWPERPELDHEAMWQRGGIIGIAEIVDVVTKKTAGDNPWFVGRYGFVLRNARPVEFTPCVGALGLFEPDFSRTYKPKPEPKTRAPKPAPSPAPPQGGLFDG